MRIGALIRALGGPTVVSNVLGIGVQAVSNWSMRGSIPREHHLALWRLATSQKVPWTPPDATGLILVPVTDDTAASPSARRHEKAA